MRTIAVVLAVCLSGIGVGVRADALSYRNGPLAELRKEVPALGVGASLLQSAAEQPVGVAALPELSKDRYFVVVPLGEGPKQYVAAFDPKVNSPRGALYVDTDGDGDLAEESPAAWKIVDGAHYFGPIAVTLSRDGQMGTYEFYMRRYRSSRSDYWRLESGCYNVGELKIGDETRRAAVVDANCNGLFNDRWSPTVSVPDQLYVDWDGNGKFTSPEALNCTARYVRDDHWYAVSLSADGRTISFAPASFAMGAATFGDFDLAAEFLSATGQGGFLIRGIGRIPLPADEYRILRCWVRGAAEDGAMWEGTSGQDPILSLSVREGEDTALKAGAPFKASLVTLGTPVPTPGKDMLFKVALKGSDGKDYQFRRGTSVMPPPKMVIKDESGKEIGSYAFQYG